MLSSFILLIAGHIFADYYLQLSKLGAYKRKNLLALIAHALIWAFVLSLILMFNNLFAPEKFCFLFITHFFIDWLKIRYFKASLHKINLVNVMDQLLHLGTILVVLFL